MSDRQPSIAGLSPRQKRELLARLLLEKSQQPRTFPLSFMQEALWFLDQLAPGSPLYNVPAAVRIGGALDVDLLRRSLNAVVARHAVLRTVFCTTDGSPRQRVLSELEVEVPLVDLSGSPPASRETEALGRVIEEARRPFDLSRGPLLRALLVRLSPDEHVFLLTIHHIVSDGWSMGVFVREMVALYEGFRRGNGAPLRRLPVQYADFAAWQRESISGGALHRQLHYWKGQLAGASETLDLPTDHLRPAVPSYRGGRCRLELSAELSESLQTLSRREGVTLFMTLLAAFEVLLWRYSGQDDLCVGTPVAGRNRAELEGLIGFFVNTLVLRGNLAEDPPFREFLQQTFETTMGAYAHQELPFEQLVEQLQPQRRLSRSPLFQVMFVLQNAPRGALEVPGLSLTPLPLEVGTAKFDLTLSVEDSGGRLGGWLEYNADLFEESTVRRMVGQLQTLLAGVVADPQRRLSELPMLDDEERRRVLVEWRGRRSEDPVEGCVHQLFESHAAARPEATALVFEGQDLSYGELNRRANRLAGHLRHLGVGPEVLVGLCLDRSPQQIVGLLGILKAGGAYLPLDPHYPAERLGWMLADSGAGLLVSDTSHRGLFGQYEGEVICLDEAQPTLAGYPSDDPECVTRSEHLAYVIYTSGWTGRPKGVLIEHRGVCNLVWGQAAAWEVTPEDRVLQFASISFDASVSDVFVTLGSGATLVVAPREELASDRGLVELLRDQRCTVAKLPPSMLSLLPDCELPSLRLMISAGESCRGESVDRWAPPRRFLNVYGPTEATVCATLGECRAGQPRHPIGRPLPNVEVYVLDRHLEPVPIGVPGELYLGGLGLARGYLNRPELTAEKFVANPFGERSGSRLYRTGDLVRYLADGSLEHLGRLDNQVKVRGFRIELGEIESILGGHPGLRQVAVTVREDRPGQRQLVAYVVGEGGQSPRVEELRDYLTARLPEYMVPSVFVSLEALPRLPNGKLDRRSLPPPGSGRPELQREYVAPRTPNEELLAGVWSEVLGVERVGVWDNFFELGGHSLLAVQVISRVRQRIRVELPLRRLFEQPTVAGLAKSIETAKTGGAASDEVSIPVVPRDGELPLSFAQQRFWFLDQLQPGNPAYNIFRYFQLSGPFDFDAAERAIREIVRRHEIMRTTFQTVDGRAVQVIAPSIELDVHLTDLSHLPDDDRDAEVWRLIATEGRIPFDLSKGPLFRIRVLRTGADKHVMLVTKHHIISDGWSVRVMIRELVLLYEALKAGRRSPLPELTIQYADFAVWHRRWLEGEVLGRQLDYWRAKLAGLAPLELPTYRPRSARGERGGASESFTVPDECIQALYELSLREGVTAFMTLLAAFKVLLYRYSGQEDVAVGSTIANRNRLGTESLIGFFVNTLVLRTDLSGNPTFRELLGRVRETALGAYEHEDLPFERLVEELNPPRQPGRNPLFSVLVNYPQGRATVEELQPPAGIRVGPVEARREHRRRWVRNTPGPFDMTLTLSDRSSGFEGRLSYDTALFDAETAKRMMRHYRILLEAAVADPDGRISDLALMDEPEAHCVVSRWNVATGDNPPGVRVSDLFEAEAAAAPQSVAVVDRRSQMTYGELNRRANRLARHLISRGVGTGVPVGICTERSAELLVAVLGVLKAGGAYVPLDPAYSEESRERARYTWQDAGVSLLIGRQELLDALGSIDVDTLALDSHWPEIRAHGSKSLPGRRSAEDLAYVIYTSGSTGRPKGVMVTHGNLLNAYLGWEDAYGLRRAVRSHLQMASFGFDVFTGDMVRALCSGGKLVICPQEVMLDPEGLLELMRREEVDCAEFVPAVLRNLLGHLEATGQSLDFMRLVIAGSDAWHVGDHLRARAVCGPHTRLINSYGLTETTIDSTFYEGHVDGTSDGALVPIGRPIRNTRTYVLDRRGRPVPIGVPGELYIGGRGVARGYRTRADLTAQRFLPDPWAGLPGARMCKTGDLVRWRADGQLEFLGRTDHQVKIRGFRIEPGEVEAVLAEHPAVHQAVVVARDDAPDSKRLVGYLVVRQQPVPLVEELRSFLGRRLPKYMIPSALVALESLPTTPSGKVDLKALPAPDPAHSPWGGEYVAPRNATEDRLAAIWAEVLKLERVGVHDDFFHLGGHSLLAVEVLWRVRREFSIELPLAVLLASTTIAELADRVEGILHGESTTSQREMQFAADLVSQWLVTDTSSRSPLVAIQPQGGKPPIFCTHGLGGDVSVFGPLAEQLGPEQPFYGLRAQGLNGQDGPQERIEEMAACYLEAIRTVQPEGPYLLAGWSMGGIIALEIARQLAAAGQPTDLVAMFDTHCPDPERISKGLDDAVIMGWISRRLGFPIQDVEAPASEDPWQLVLEQARAAALVPAEVKVSQLRGLAQVCKAHVAALGSYELRDYRGRVIVFRAAGPSDAARGTAARDWDTLLDNVEIRRVDGGHLGMLRRPHVDVLAAELAKYLAEVGAPNRRAGRR